MHSNVIKREYGTSHVKKAYINSQLRSAPGTHGSYLVTEVKGRSHTEDFFYWTSVKFYCIFSSWTFSNPFSKKNVYWNIQLCPVLTKITVRLLKLQ